MGRRKVLYFCFIDHSSLIPSTPFRSPFSQIAALVTAAQAVSQRAPGLLYQTPLGGGWKKVPCSQANKLDLNLLLARPPSLQTQATLQLWFHLELHKAETALALSLTRPLSSPPFPSPLPTQSSWEKPGATEAEIVSAVLLSPLELVCHFPLLGSFALSPFHLLFQFLAFQFKSHQSRQNCTVQIITWKMSSSVYRIGTFLTTTRRVMRTWCFVCCVASLKMANGYVLQLQIICTINTFYICPN